MAGFPLRVALLSTLPVWHNVRMHVCVFMCVHPSVCLAQTSVSGPALNAALHSFSDDLFREAKVLQSRKAHQTDRRGIGQW